MGKISHAIRDMLRTRALNNVSRWDMAGVQNGIDYDKTRALLQDTSFSFLNNGILRTILAGAVWSPSRMLAGGKLTPAAAACVHCTAGVPETLGHRYALCPTWSQIRLDHGVTQAELESYPRCLSRCGIVPLGHQIGKAQAKSLQRMMVCITRHIIDSAEAQKQYKTARGCKDARSQRSLMAELANP